MCGIAGIFHYQRSTPVDVDNLLAIRRMLEHRGPDGEGIFLNPEGSLGLASTRLAIQDLSSAGSQPFTDSASGATIVFNGEIYNARALRSSLQSRGARFQSSSDTEVLLRLYCEVGEKMLDMINGIFAFAIWDERRQTLFLARDHVGVKPLYYAEHRGTFIFASEAKALLKYRDLPATVNHAAISSYLTFSCNPAPDTLFEHVKKLPAATSLTVRKDTGKSVRNYWRPIQPRLLEETARATEDECIELVRNGLKSAVRDQLAGDVPVTCALSGGVDSSAIASLMGSFSSHPLTFFTIGFDGDWDHHNEFSYARLAAERAGAGLIELRVTSGEVLDFLESRFAESCDDPCADPVCGLAFFLSREMRRHGFKAAMSGEGSDEIFLGYQHYLQSLAWYEGIPDGASNFGNSYWGNAIGFRVEDLHLLLTRDFRSRHLDEAAHRAPIEEAHRDSISDIHESDLPRRVSLIELKIRLPEMLLMRVDKMTMANSLECRVPFLDKNMVELALAIRTNVKISGGEPKAILKKAVEGIIPAENIHRKKMGFHLPITEWLRHEKIGSRLIDLLRNSRLMNSGILQRDVVSTLITEHQSGSHDRHFKLWTLLTLSLWYERWA